MSKDLVKNALKVAYFCKFHSRNQLQFVKIALGEEEFKKALEFLEKVNIIEYPIVYPEFSTDFPRGMPYPGVNYFLVNFIYYPAWIQGYMSHLQELKKLIERFKITRKLIETLRKEISEIDPEYKDLIRAQLNTVALWSTQDKKVIEQLLNRTYHGKINFSESAIYWKE